MSVSLLGTDATGALLSGLGRVTLVNRTAAESTVLVVAAALVRHRSGEDPHTDAGYALGLGADQSVEFEAAPPLTAPPEAIEVVLRLLINDQTTADAYAVAFPGPADGGRAEFGVKDNRGVLDDGERTVPGFPEFTVYALPGVAPS
jgi:hypothetical protein